MEVPYGPHRRTIDTIALKAALGGPQMAETSDRWITAHGRHIRCRLYRPRINETLPVMVHFHGGRADLKAISWNSPHRRMRTKRAGEALAGGALH
jgi:acetyl esterase/lipase